ncbi:hypothetical protein F5B17DRAFT_192028 [Nemania serpens]|nr:hypothetical protein F5B17DRAFT_192028 [Nemania serpens]
MAIEFEPTWVFSPRETCPIQDHPPSTHSYMSSHPNSTDLSLVPSIPSSPSPVTNMKTLPQGSGWASLRAVKKGPSFPRLGDGLLTAFTCNAALTTSTTYTNPDVSTILTSSSLDQLAQSTHPDGDSLLVGTPSACSDEDDILIGRLSWSINLKSPSRLSSRFDTSGGDETPPTTLTGDDSSSSSNEETALRSLPSTVVDSKTISGTETTPSPSTTSKDTIERTKCQPRVTKPIDPYGACPAVHYPISKLSELFKSVSANTGAEVVPDGEITPTVEYLYGIVRGFLATETKAKTLLPLETEPHQCSICTSPATDMAKPFWGPQRTIEPHLKVETTAGKATETAQRYSSPGVLPSIDGTGASKKKKPSVRLSNTLTEAASEGSHGDFCQPMSVSAEALERDRYDKIHDDFRLKLAAYSAKDGLAGAVKPLHIFVDMSNIHIGFCNSWKISQCIPVDRRVRAPAFNFKTLASIMERSRPAKKRVLASSVASHVVSRTQWPQHFVDAEKQGYKTSILSRVQKISPVKARRRRKPSMQATGIIHSTTVITSGDESADDSGRACFETRNEYATRALSQGWDLELVT